MLPTYDDIVSEDYLPGTCSYDPHALEHIAGIDLQRIIIDQEDVFDLHDVRISSPEDRIHIA